MSVNSAIEVIIASDRGGFFLGDVLCEKLNDAAAATLEHEMKIKMNWAVCLMQ